MKWFFAIATAASLSLMTQTELQGQDYSYGGYDTNSNYNYGNNEFGYQGAGYAPGGRYYPHTTWPTFQRRSPFVAFLDSLGRIERRKSMWLQSALNL